MPLAVLWTRAPGAELPFNTLSHFRETMANVIKDDWALPFMDVIDGKAVDVQPLTAKCFPVARQVQSRPRLSLRYQGYGSGNEMRSAAFNFAFTELDAKVAYLLPYIDKKASIAVSRRSGYQDSGVDRWHVRESRCSSCGFADS